MNNFDLIIEMQKQMWNEIDKVLEAEPEEEEEDDFDDIDLDEVDRATKEAEEQDEAVL